jgi:hypothetical protein
LVGRSYGSLVTLSAAKGAMPDMVPFTSFRVTTGYHTGS